jgi:hypothetical protein
VGAPMALTIDLRGMYFFFMYFLLSIHPQGLGVMMNETFFDIRINREGFDGFGEHVGNVINSVCGQCFSSIRRKEI